MAEQNEDVPFAGSPQNVEGEGIITVPRCKATLCSTLRTTCHQDLSPRETPKLHVIIVICISWEKTKSN